MLLNSAQKSFVEAQQRNCKPCSSFLESVFHTSPPTFLKLLGIRESLICCVCVCVCVYTRIYCVYIISHLSFAGSANPSFAAWQRGGGCDCTAANWNSEAFVRRARAAAEVREAHAHAHARARTHSYSQTHTLSLTHRVTDSQTHRHTDTDTDIDTDIDTDMDTDTHTDSQPLSLRGA
jgi:hypothetical protein